jgi:hypothetical protein
MLIIKNLQKLLVLPYSSVLCCIYMQWDILSNGGLVQEMAHIANGRDPGNCVSLLRVNVSFTLNFFNDLGGLGLGT